MASETEETKKSAAPQQTKKTKTRKGWKIASRVAVVVLVVGLAVFGAYYFKQYKDIKNNPISAEEAKNKENERIVSAVGKLYNLPKDEQPTIFFVTDKNKLSDDYKKQEFFQKAENGDYVLIYEKGKIAILYRPSTNQLVDVRPYTVQSSLSVAIIGPQANRDATEKALQDKFKSELSIATKADAKASYAGVTVVDLSGKYTEQVKKIAEGIGAQVGTLPAGEDKPQGADILIVAGAPATAPAPTQ